ncbi:hypothetical protein HEP84_07450 [Streptomyces sp. RLB1-33]|uniref:hypothetical protein n=1 Tax=Streptomyces mirabilis TaxID=68239 RepID=UPI00143E5813|nr:MULTISPECIES: hypothetical protein [Streptomyces]QIY69060.1 hypothetical protein HEP84_07450 [Streptomyces sp. RLB1-33]QUW84165.1 hypothetical protein SMIR_37685 [Streptomyces mirabilis]
MRTLTARLSDDRPDDATTSVIHNDWRLDNLVLDESDLYVTATPEFLRPFDAARDALTALPQVDARLLTPR